MSILQECPPPRIDNKTPNWTEHDKEVCEEISKHCYRIYGDGYCAKVIEKIGENRYKVLCFTPDE